MPDERAIILAYLSQHRGPAAAVTAEEMARAIFGRAAMARKVRRIISELIVEGGHGLIVANPGGESFGTAPRGYFVATSPEEMAAYHAQLISRLDELRKRERAAWRAWQRMLRREKGQGRLIEVATTKGVSKVSRCDYCGWSGGQHSSICTLRGQMQEGQSPLGEAGRRQVAASKGVGLGL